MKTIFALMISALVMFTVSASFAKARPAPKPAPKCPKGQHWDNSMKMCMRN